MHEKYADNTPFHLKILQDIRSGRRETLTLEQLDHVRQRPKLERVELVRKTREKLIEQYQKAGMIGSKAEVAAIDDMEQLGFYPKSRKIVATLLDQPLMNSEVFEISDNEFKIGMFQDIGKAISFPGKEIHFWGRYIHHRDYTTSMKLNRYLQSHTSFQVQTARGLFLMHILY